MRRMFGFLIGILVGGLVGGTIALLMAPESGEDAEKISLVMFVTRRMSARSNCARNWIPCGHQGKADLN